MAKGDAMSSPERAAADHGISYIAAIRVLQGLQWPIAVAAA
jgi:hypothetical protein